MEKSASLFLLVILWWYVSKAVSRPRQIRWSHSLFISGMLWVVRWNVLMGTMEGEEEEEEIRLRRRDRYLPVS